MPLTTEEKSGTKTIYGPCALIFCSAQTGSWRIVRPSVDPERCVLCGICEKHCPTGVVTVGSKEASGTVEIDMTYCKGCGICADICPHQAIAMIDERQV